jgi:hypothetical protein
MSVETRLARSLARIAGADPAQFHASVEQPGVVRVAGPRGIATYPIECWISRFIRHLYRGFFGAPVALQSDALVARTSCVFE